MLTAMDMRWIADDACTDEEYGMAQKWLYEQVLQEAERGNTMFALRIDMKSPTPNFKMCLTRLKREFEEADYEFRMYWNDNGRPCRIEVAW